MTSASRGGRRTPRARLAAALAGSKWAEGRSTSTGARIFAVLILALLPLGILAVVGTLVTIQSAEAQRERTLSLDAATAAGRLLDDLNRDRAALSVIANILERVPERRDICGRANSELRPDGRPVVFAAYDRTGRRLCQNRGGDVARPFAQDAVSAAVIDGAQAAILPASRRLVVQVSSIEGAVRSVASYDAAQLAAMAGIDRRAPGFLVIELVRGGSTIELVRRGHLPRSDHVDRASAPLDIGGIRFVTMTERPPIDLIRVTATLLPILMWLGTAGIGWWVVNRVLIRPLVDLNARVAEYQPGRLLDTATAERPGVVREIDLLAGTFREIAQDVVEHESQLAAALVRQQALTREVHHRVKNNLQIIASLINLHSRAATTEAAEAAYASIQRRVDALSVVHRNHYAAAELSRGIEARALITELASALRASVPETIAKDALFAIRLDGDNVYLSQDVAVPIAFLITELVEMVLLQDQPGPVWIALRRTAEGSSAELSVRSDRLCPSPALERLLTDRFSRVLVGLSRQLRSVLRHDGAEGRYTITIPVQP